MNQLALFEQLVTVSDDFTNDDYENPNWLAAAMARKCYDAVFDIRLGKAQSPSTLIFKYV